MALVSSLGGLQRKSLLSVLSLLEPYLLFSDDAPVWPQPRRFCLILLFLVSSLYFLLTSQNPRFLSFYGPR